MNQNDFIDFKSIVNNTIWNTIATSTISTYEAESNGQVNIYYDYSDIVSKKVEMPHLNESFKLAYEKKIPLKKDKVEDIFKILENKWIPLEHEYFYRELIEEVA